MAEHPSPAPVWAYKVLRRPVEWPAHACCGAMLGQKGGRGVDAGAGPAGWPFRRMRDGRRDVRATLQLASVAGTCMGCWMGGAPQI